MSPLFSTHLEGVEVDKVNERRSSDRISKLCERLPESTMEFSPISGDDALELEDVLGVIDLKHEQMVDGNKSRPVFVLT